MSNENPAHIYRISIPVRPVGKARARKAKYTNHFYTSEGTVINTRWIRSYAKALIPKPLAGPVILHIWFMFAKKNVKWDDDLPHFAKPDIDNTAKLVKDALNGIAYHDDCQVSDSMLHKRYSDKNEINITVQNWAPALVI